MADYSSLTTSGISSLISSYKQVEYNRRIAPLSTRKDKYDNISSALSTLSTKTSALKSTLYNLKQSAATSVFNTKNAISSKDEFMTATAENTASVGSYEFFISQLAKNDLAVSKDVETDTVSGLNGTHSFVIKTGDGSTGEYISNIEAEFDGTETNKEMMEKLRDAINSDKAVINSDAKVAADSYAGGPSTFTIDLNGTETEITVNGGGTYEDLIDEVLLQINENIDGVVAEKVIDSPSAGDVSLKLTVTNSEHYVSISHTSGNDIVSDLNIGVTKEKGASGIVSAAVFTPRSGYQQFSITSKETGIDNRIKELSDVSGTALDALGLNLGASRPSFDQNADPDTPGFVYADITDTNNLLNSKFVFNGLNIQKSSNSVEDLVDGMTFNLHSTMQDTDNNVNISVNNNAEETKKAIEDFITKFNDVYTFIKNNSGSKDGVRGSLISEANSRSLIQTLQNSIYQEVTGLTAGSITYLSQIGISFDSGSGLSISDSTLLEQRLSDDADQVKNLFASSNGIATSLYDKVNSYLGIEGYLNVAKESYSNSTSYIDDRIETIQASINKSAEVLRNRYQNMQVQLAQLLNMQSQFSFEEE